MGRLAELRLVIGNASLRRVVGAFAAFNLADWARWLAILLYAFERGGAVEAGAVSMLQLLPATVAAPIGAAPRVMSESTWFRRIPRWRKSKLAATLFNDQQRPFGQKAHR